MKRLILMSLLSLFSLIGFSEDRLPLDCNDEVVIQKFSELYDQVFERNGGYFVEVKQVKGIAYDKRINLRACAIQFVAHMKYYSGGTPYETQSFYYDLVVNKEGGEWKDKLIMKLREDYEIIIQ